MTSLSPSIPEGVVAYAIGDVHGLLELLNPLLEQILADADATPGRRPVVIGLGDYIDRGLQSRGVIDALIAFSQRDDVESHFLRGNHDQVMLDFLADPSWGRRWNAFGGRETLWSYGVEPPARLEPAEGWSEARDALAEAVPAAHLEFLQGLERSFTLGDYFFCHAGARPGVALEEQEDEDLFWIREPFLDDPEPFAKVVVHGHSPTATVHSDFRRIGVDTGAYATGLLTALRLDGADKSLIQARRSGPRAVELLTNPI